MKVKLYAVQDTMVGFARPFTGINEMAVKRDYTDFLSDPQTTHPEDKRLYELGTYDDETGEIKAITPKLIQGGSVLCKAGGEENGESDI